MKSFLDTSVLVAALTVQHIHHGPSVAVYHKLTKRQAYCSAHGLAELYATLTRLPGKQRIDPDQALLLLEDVQERVTTIAMDENEYRAAIVAAATEGIIGGTICDALHGWCAIKVHADTIYTWNVNHFTRLSPEIAKRVRTP